MTVTNFIILFSALSLLSSLLTEAIKKIRPQSPIPKNIIALICAIVVGGLGTASAYVIAAIPFTLVNIICLIYMVLAIWIGAMVGYDKVIQTIEQIIKGKK